MNDRASNYLSPPWVRHEQFGVFRSRGAEYEQFGVGLTNSLVR
jgi:hypothetical protein